ncbi:MAG: hypothetical protein V8Q79_07985 [Christensenellales bacterium]
MKPANRSESSTAKYFLSEKGVSPFGNLMSASRSHRIQQAVHIETGGCFTSTPGYRFTSTRVNGWVVILFTSEFHLSARESCTLCRGENKKEKPLIYKDFSVLVVATGLEPFKAA